MDLSPRRRAEHHARGQATELISKDDETAPAALISAAGARLDQPGPLGLKRVEVVEPVERFCHSDMGPERGKGSDSALRRTSRDDSRWTQIVPRPVVRQTLATIAGRPGHVSARPAFLFRP